ncbi:MAG: polysaccharide biosynthesis/export protein, partial [Bradyrhizobium sp.]|nr:polysaccharide biosynthesis/export protein [Bradyrhizobium sp.]
MRGLRAVLVCLLTALALSGCMRRSAPVAVAQPRSDLDSLAYGQTTNPPPRVVASSGGAIGALRASFAASPRRAYAAAPAVYAAPVPVAYDAVYKLDAGDRLRIVVYGQEGLTNTYAIDAGGSITMP